MTYDCQNFIQGQVYLISLSYSVFLKKLKKK